MLSYKLRILVKNRYLWSAFGYLLIWNIFTPQCRKTIKEWYGNTYKIISYNYEIQSPCIRMNNIYEYYVSRILQVWGSICSKTCWETLYQIPSHWHKLTVDWLVLPGRGHSWKKWFQWPPWVNNALTFQCYPVLFPLPPGHQLQLLFLLQSDEGFEEQPSSFSDHPLLLLKEQIKLLQRAEGPTAGVCGFCGRFYMLCAGPAHFQLPHEILINVLLEGIAANCMSRFASLGQDLSRAPRPQWSRHLEGPLHVCIQSIWAAVKVVTAFLGPRLLWAMQTTTHQRSCTFKASLPQHQKHVIPLFANAAATKQDSSQKFIFKH